MQPDNQLAILCSSGYRERIIKHRKVRIELGEHNYRYTESLKVIINHREVTPTKTGLGNMGGGGGVVIVHSPEGLALLCREGLF